METPKGTHIPTALAQANAEIDAEIERLRQTEPPQPIDDLPPRGEEQPQPDAEPAFVQPPHADPTRFDATPSAPAPAGPQPTGPDAWQQRYEVLKGKYDAEVPRLTSQVRELQRSVEVMTGLLERQPTVAAAPNAAAPAPANDGAPTEDEYNALGITKRMRDEMGDEYFMPTVMLARRLAKPPADDGVRHDLAALRQERFVEQMDRAMPEWRQMDTDPGFIAWLDGTIEPRTGMTYRQLLQRAASGYNAASTAAIFADYRASVQPAAQPRRMAQPVPAARQAVPRPAAAAPAAAAPKDTRVWTLAEINNAAKRIATGELPAPRAKALRDAMDLAIQEGRVQP